MRLGQLARTIDKKPVELLVFLKQKGIEHYSHPNSKMTEEDEQMVLAHFGVSTPVKSQVVENKVNSESTESETDKVSEIENTPEEVNIELSEELVSEETQKEVADTIINDTNTDQDYTNVEVIKAPKIELPGLKVVGKIDLPEPKKKEEVPAEEGDGETSNRPKKEYRSNDRNRNRGRNNQQRRERDPNYNPIAARREREKQREERERLKAEKKIKQKKKEHYLEKVAELKATPSKNKSVPKPASYTQSVEENKRKEYGIEKQPNVFKRIWRWLNTY